MSQLFSLYPDLTVDETSSLAGLYGVTGTAGETTGVGVEMAGLDRQRDTADQRAPWLETALALGCAVLRASGAVLDEPTSR
jgi:hypothetical protein